MTPEPDIRTRQAGRPISAILGQLVNAPGDRLTVSDVVEAFGPQGFGALMFVFAIPNLLPLPPGSSTFLSIPLLLIAPQVMVGHRALWLPRIGDRRSLSRADLARLAGPGLARLARIERLLRPRLGFLFGAVGDRLIGAVILALSLVLVLPIPLGNLLPAAAIAALSLGLAQRDGLVALVGYAVAAASALVLFFTAHAVVAAAHRLLGILGAD